MARTYSNPAEACAQVDSFDPLDDIPVPAGHIRVRIHGLRQVGDDIFELSGVEVREVDWAAVAKAMERKFIPDALADKIDSACFQYDVAEALAERIERR